jgi:hypothetical protein
LGTAIHDQRRPKLRVEPHGHRDLEWQRYLGPARATRRLAQKPTTRVPRLDHRKRIRRQRHTLPVGQATLDHADAVLRRGRTGQRNGKDRGGHAARKSSEIPHHGFPLFVVPRDT